MTDNFNSEVSSPRFVDTGNFMRMKRVETAEDLDFAIYGIPFDTGTSFRPGARFAPQSIRTISALIKPNHPVYEINLFDYLKGGDLGDVPIVPGYIHPSYEQIEKFTRSIVKEGAVPIAIGGDHSITLGELRAIAKEYGPVSLLQFDSHADINDDSFGEKYTHGTVFKRAIEENLIDPHQSVQIGMRGSIYEPDEFKHAEELGLTLIPTHEVKECGIKEVLKQAKNIIGINNVFLTFDIDFIDPAYAPATGTPEVGGFTSFEAVQIIRNLRDLNFVGMDMVEVSPKYDLSEVTSLTAANLIFEFLSVLAADKIEKE